MYPRLGLKTAVTNYADGWGEKYLMPLIRAGIPPVVGALDGAGFAYEAQEAMREAGWSYEKQRQATIVYRNTENDIPDYQLSPQDAADRQWEWHNARWPRELDRRIVYGGITNESAFVLGEADLPNGGGPYRKWFQHVGNDNQWKWDNSEWLAAHAYRLCEHALAAGVRFTVFGWSPGTPESWQWRGPEMAKLLNLLRQYPDDLAIDLHEGSLIVDHLDTPSLIGRWRNIPRPLPSIIVTEFSWTLNKAPVVEIAMPQLLDAYRKHYAYPHIKGVVVWSLTKGKSWSDIGATVNTYMGHIAYAMLNLDIPPLADETPLPPPTPEPEPPPVSNVNMLKNPSFNDEDWTDATEFSGQHPKYWLVAYNDLPNEVVPSQPNYGPIEGVHKGKGELPQDEWDLYLLDEGYCYKLFAPGPRPIWGRLKQEIPDLPAGRYKLTTRAYNDCHRKSPSGKDYNLEPNHAQTMIKLNGKVVRDWTNLKAGEWHHTETAINHAGGIFDLAVHFRANWGTENAFFLDDWSLVKIEEPVPPEPPMPDKPLEEVLWERATSVAPTNLDAALQKHILSTANYTPYGPEKWVAYEGLQYATQAAMDWGNMRQRVYWCRVPEWDNIYFIDDPEATLEFVVWPVKRTPAVTQAFGARPEVYQQYGFPRGHEGIDLRANLNDPVLAVADGMVTGVHEGGNYGKYIKIAHAGGWVTLYAHLNAFAMLDVGDYVTGGQTIGFAGTTGNSTGTHLHFGLSHATSTYTDAEGNRWPKGIHDPTDYLTPFLSVPPAPAGLDLLPYIKGDGTIYQMKVIWQGQEHSQQMQTQTGYGSAFYLVKNNEWEEFHYDSEYIYRGIDTSPGNGMYYWQRQNALETKARWCLRIMAAGQTYERNPLVTFYDKSTGAKLENPASNYRRSWLRFAKHHASWRHPQGALPFADVVELHWLLKPDATTPAETYFYAKNYGLVGWSSSNGDYSFVVEVFRPGERSPMVRESITIR